MDYIKIRNWDKWQTYRSDRGQPPWIKIHRRVMRNPEWVSLSDAERGQLVSIWILAADHDGIVPASPEVIQKLCFMTKPPNLNKFTDLGFIENGWRQPDVTPTPIGSQHDTPEAKAEAEKKRIYRSEFNAFWGLYPKKEKKKDAAKAWKALTDGQKKLAMKALPAHIKKWKFKDKQYIPAAGPWLRGERWEDEIDGHKGGSRGHANSFL